MDKFLYECHGHLVMDGQNFKAARARHLSGPVRSIVEEELASLAARGVKYYRDGGDAQGVSLLGRRLAPDYGIEFATPGFAIHREGYYGGLVGRGYRDMDEYRALLGELRKAGGDFVKIMVSGMITFREYGETSCPHLPPEEIKALIDVAHGEGYAVMLHVNGDEAIRAVLDAGGDSIEHGYFMSEDTLRRLAASKAVWVPTLAAVAAFIDREGFNGEVARETVARQQQALRFAAGLGAKIAAGSDSGAVGVPLGPGTEEEYRLLAQAGLTPEQIRAGSEAIRKRFRAPEPPSIRPL